MNARHNAGLSLIELLVATLLASLVMIAALSLAATASSSLRASDVASDIQERARFAMASIEYDLQHAGYLGLTARGRDFGFLQGGDPAATLPPAALRQFAPAIAALPSSAHSCGENYAIDVAVPVQADNDSYALGRNRATGCAPRNGARAAADTLTIRRASIEAVSPDPGRVQLLVDAVDPARRWLLADGLVPGGVSLLPDQLQLHDLETAIYYVSQRSDGAADVPALRRKLLTRVAGVPTFVDTEVISGVEDLQLQFQTARGVFTPDLLPAGAPVLAVTVWLRVRTTLLETSHHDASTYVYAGHSASISAAERSYRRLLVSRTIAVRNGRAN
jgi:type IV pilus assembly protein PilW